MVLNRAETLHMHVFACSYALDGLGDRIVLSMSSGFPFLSTVFCQRHIETARPAFMRFTPLRYFAIAYR